MTAQELIQKYNIALQTKLTDKGWELTGMLAIREVAACKRDGKLDEIKAKSRSYIAAPPFVASIIPWIAPYKWSSFGQYLVNIWSKNISKSP